MPLSCRIQNHIQVSSAHFLRCWPDHLLNKVLACCAAVVVFLSLAVSFVPCPDIPISWGTFRNAARSQATVPTTRRPFLFRQPPFPLTGIFNPGASSLIRVVFYPSSCICLLTVFHHFSPEKMEGKQAAPRGSHCMYTMQIIPHLC